MDDSLTRYQQVEQTYIALTKKRFEEAKAALGEHNEEFQELLRHGERTLGRGAAVGVQLTHSDGMAVVTIEWSSGSTTQGKHVDVLTAVEEAVKLIPTGLDGDELKKYLRRRRRGGLGD